LSRGFRLAFRRSAVADKTDPPKDPPIKLTEADKLLLTRNPADMTRREKVNYLRLLLHLRGKLN